MSDKRESDEAYLTRRGWIVVHGGMWMYSPSRDNAPLNTAEALTIQAARDEQEERAAWVQFAAGRLAFGFEDPDGGEHFENSGGAAETADAMLAQYRARFARKVSE